MDTTRIGHYTIVSELGRGGMGVVYKAHEESLNRFVAIKVLSEQLASDPSFVARFVREARAAAALSHPNIIQIFYIGEDAGRNYFVMEYVTGQSLLGLVRERGKLAGPQAAQFMLQAAHGLAAAHDLGVIHRDIKPANLMVDDRGLLKIADFGLALPQDALTRLTTTGMLVGTPGYLSPEQCRGDKPDARSDIYSLGVTFFETLTGRLPFQADSPLAMLRKILDEAPPDVASLAGDVDPPVHDIVHKMLAKDPGERYQDCHALAGDLEEYLVQKGVRGVAAVFSGGAAARPPAPPPPSPAAPDGPQAGMATQATVPMESGSRVQSAPPRPAAAAPAAAGSALVGTAGPVVAVEPPRAASHRGLLIALLAIAAVAVVVVGMVLLLLRLPIVKRFLPGGASQAATATSSEASESTARDDNVPSGRRLTDAAAPPPPAVAPAQPAPVTGRAGEAGGSASASRGTVSPPHANSSKGGSTATGSRGVAPGGSARDGGTEAGGGARETRSTEAALHGIAVAAVGEEGIASVVASSLSQELSSGGEVATDASAMPELEELVGGGAVPRIADLLRAARNAGVATLVVVRLEPAGQRELRYMGRYDVAYRTRAVATCFDVAAQRPRGAAVTAEMEYTSLNRETVVSQRMAEVARSVATLLR